MEFGGAGSIIFYPKTKGSYYDEIRKMIPYHPDMMYISLKFILINFDT